MKAGMLKNIYHKYIALIIAIAFFVVTFACFLMMSTNTLHTTKMNFACEIVMTVVGNTVVQTGVALLLLAVTIGIVGNVTIFTISTIMLLAILRCCSTGDTVCYRDYSYLSRLFSSGLLHSKLYLA